MSTIGIATNVRKLRLIAWGDLTVWTFLMVPLLGILLWTVVAIPTIFLAMFALAIPAEIFFRFFSRAAIHLPAELEPIVAKCCDDVAQAGGIKLSTARFRYDPDDVNTGGQVVGMLFPRIVVSGALLVALKRNEARAFAVMAHEMAHVSHLDRLNYAYFTLWLINAVIPVVYHFVGMPVITTLEQALLWLANCIFTFFVCGLFMRERELLADASAALIVGPERYADVLREGQDSPGNGGGYFHPSLRRRCEAVSMNPPEGLRIRKKALAIYLTFFLIGMYSAWVAGAAPCRVLSDGNCYEIIFPGEERAEGLQFEQLFGIAQMIAAFAGMALELFRASLPIPAASLAQVPIEGPQL